MHPFLFHACFLPFSLLFFYIFIIMCPFLFHAGFLPFPLLLFYIFIIMCPFLFHACFLPSSLLFFYLSIIMCPFLFHAGFLPFPLLLFYFFIIQCPFPCHTCFLPYSFLLFYFIVFVKLEFILKSIIIIWYLTFCTPIHVLYNILCFHAATGTLHDVVIRHTLEYKYSSIFLIYEGPDSIIFLILVKHRSHS